MISTCSQCGGVVQFDDVKQCLICSSCGSEFAVTNSEKIKIDVNHNKAFECSGCGAIISYDDSIIADRCLFCGNTSVKAVVNVDTITPDSILLFKSNADEIITHFRQDVNKGFYKKLFTRNILADNPKITVKPMYIPYLVVDALVSTTFEGEKQGFYKGKRIICETNVHNVTMEVSKNVPDDLTGALENFDIENAIPYNPEYLYGHYGLVSDIPKEETKAKFFSRVSRYVAKVLRYYGEAAVQPNVFGSRGSGIDVYKTDEKFLWNKVNCTLIPIWFLNVKSEEIDRTFIIGGRDDKSVIGDLLVNEELLETVDTTARIAATLFGGLLPLLYVLFNCGSERTLNTKRERETLDRDEVVSCEYTVYDLMTGEKKSHVKSIMQSSGT